MIELIPATLADYPLILNLGRFYEYEMARYCGWAWEGEDGGYPSSYLTANIHRYFQEPNRYPFIIKVDQEIAGFVLINKRGSTAQVDWKIGEFFILGKFQGKSIGKQVANQIWQQFPGAWELTVMPSNTGAYHFWKKVISAFTNCAFTEEEQILSTPEPQPMIIFRFSSSPE